MASSASRTRASRRDRRKAKATGYRREGKTQMGHVGHGSSGPTTRTVTAVQRPAPIGPVPHQPQSQVAGKHRLRVSVADIVRKKGT